MVPAVDRTDPGLAQPERDMLTSFLDWHRETLQHKCSGLSPAQLAQAACPPSNLTLFGLMRHLTDVERGWFSRGSGADAPPLYYSKDDPEADIEIRGEVTDEDVDEIFRTWTEECDRSRAVIAGLGSLDDTLVDGSHTWRWVLVHMIEEYARHNGHADLIRQAIDGAVGE